MENRPMRFAALAALALTLAGCATREDRLAAWRDRCATDFGLTRGSEAHGLCVMRYDLQRQQILAQDVNRQVVVIPAR